MAALSLGLGLGLGAQSQRAAPVAAAAPASLLDRLPRVTGNGYAAALAVARARGAAGRADALWIELFYGDAAAQAEAEQALRAPAPGGETAEMAFLQFLAADIQGQDRQTLDAALRLLQAAPNDVASELAVRTLSGQLQNQGRTLLDAVPALEHELQQPLADPTTSYMLGRALLAAVHAPGLALTPEAALRLSGRLAHWQLWGPFGQWPNLGFDQTFALERAPAASFADGNESRTPQAYTSVGAGVQFPQDWGRQGVFFAETWLRAERPTRVLVRLYAQASALIEINGAVVMSNDRRSRYTPATMTAALELAPGWNRVVVKLAGEAGRTFDLMLRPAPGATLEDAAALPPGGAMATAARRLAPPITLTGWSAQRLARDGQDAVALWADGVCRVQDEDAEHARVALEAAAKLAPRSTLVWLELADAYGQLNDASQSWAAAQIEQAAQQALKASPRAARAYAQLGRVYESQGKSTQAAEQFAHCSNRGFADCDWSEFRLAASQRWLPEAEAALGHALAESGSDWTDIANGLEFYASIGDAAKMAEWERVLAADPRASAALGAYRLRRGDAAQAASLFQAAVEFDPSAPELRAQQLDALLLSGNLPQAASVAQTATSEFPHDWRIAAAADEVRLRQAPAQGVAALRQTDYQRNVLRHEADFLAADKFWQPWYHSETQIIQDAPGKAAYPNASSILVFDQMVNRINPDNTQDQYIHQIYRLLNAGGIAQYGDVTTIQPGSDLITIRTIKQDGRMLLPDRITNITNISMPGLEPGDYIEIEFVQHQAASGAIPGTMDNNEFFVFNSSTQPFHYSDYIVLSPPGFPLMVDQERFPGEPTVRTLPDGSTAREWLVQKTRILVTEPHMPPEQNLVPKVWVSGQLSWDEISRYLADHLFGVRKTTPEMGAEAARLAASKPGDVAKADAIFAWVTANIQPGEGSWLAPARQSFSDRSGSRYAVFMGLLSAAQVPYQLVMARAVTDDSSTKIPSLFQFQYPLVHVAGGTGNTAAGWYDLNNDFAREQYIVPGIRGGLAVVAAASGPADFIHVPTFTSPLDGVVISVSGKVTSAGDANLHLALEFRGPNGEQVRSALANQPDSTLPQIYQQMVLANYPNGTASGGQILNRADKSKPLIIAVDATVPDFVHGDNGAAAGSSWDIARLASAVGVLARYAPLQLRTQPLEISGDTFEQTRVSLDLPARFGSASLPPAAKLENPYGRFTSSLTQSPAPGGGTHLQFDRLFFLRANLVPPGDYPAFRAFAEAVDTQDRLQLTGTLR
ncbi:MAG: hypothetical protein ACRD1L_02095 [Terriglobales bacterium]